MDGEGRRGYEIEKRVQNEKGDKVTRGGRAVRRKGKGGRVQWKQEKRRLEEERKGGKRREGTAWEFNRG